MNIFFPPDYQYVLYYLFTVIFISIISIIIDKLLERKNYKHKKIVSRSMIVLLVLLTLYFGVLPLYL